MGKKGLVVVESPSKVKSIKKFLGSDYDVSSSRGHIADLPKSEMGVDVEHKYKPKYVVSNQKTISELKKAFEDHDTLILASDPDREGEAIGWHVAKRLGVIDDKGNVKSGKNLQRIVFTSITKDAVLDALKHPRKLDINLFNAQQSRRILDRLVGYSLSPLLWKKIRFGLSAGRVQSVAVRLVVEREEERNKFVPDEYWKIGAYLNTQTKGLIGNVVLNTKDTADNVDTQKLLQKGDIRFELTKVSSKDPILTKQSESENILQEIKSAKWLVTNITSKPVTRNPKPPFTTSTLQQTASSWLNFAPKRTMSLAQKLYEDGFITYMRTDSTNFSPEAVDGARKFIQREYGKNYLPEKPLFYKTKAKVAQEAHEAIRPTDFGRVMEDINLDEDYKKLYRLIWQRALASQMNPARLESDRVEIMIQDKYLFVANGQKIKFKGYLEVYPEKISENILPDFVLGQELYLDLLLASQHFTEPPARYSEASLIKTLEEYGIGRPSTYVPIISTIQARQYVEKEGKYFKPTDTGNIVTRLLRENFPNIVSYDFTAHMEDDLDNIANGEIDWIKTMDSFFKPFATSIQEKDKTIDRESYTVLEDADPSIKCPECQSPMNIKIGRYGKFLSCKRWPECKGILSEDGKSDEEIQAITTSEEFLKTYKPAPKTDDKRDYLYKKGKYGGFWAHPDYPKVKDAKPLEYTDEVFEKIYGKAPESKDGKLMTLRRGRFGEFWAHPDYPDTKEVVRINKKAIQEKKNELGIN